MHDAGIFHRALYAKHFFIGERDGEISFHLFDLAGAQLRKVTPYLAAQDLGCLAASVPRSFATPTNMLRFLLDYENKSRIDRSSRKLAKMIEKRRARLAVRRRFLVDPSRSFLAGRPARRKKRLKPHSKKHAAKNGPSEDRR